MGNYVLKLIATKKAKARKRARQEKQLLFNRLEQYAFDRVGQLMEFKKLFTDSGGSNYFLTGSGSGFFMPVNSEREGLKEIGRLKRIKNCTGCGIYLVKGNLRGMELWKLQR